MSGRCRCKEVVDPNAPAWFSPLSESVRITGSVAKVGLKCDGELGALKSEGLSELERRTCSHSSSFLRVLANISLT